MKLKRNHRRASERVRALEKVFLSLILSGEEEIETQTRAARAS